MARLIVVSNRVAVPSRDGGNQAGGLAVAVRSLLKRHGGLWFGWSGTVVSRCGREQARPFGSGGMSYVVTDLAEADYQEYYNGFANRVLWPILHYRLDLAEFSRRDLSGYRRVNAHFATELDKPAATRRHHLGTRLSSHSACKDAARSRPPQPHRILPACAVSAAGDSHRAAATTNG